MNKAIAFSHFMKCEREYWYTKYIYSYFFSPEKLTLLEVGAGAGDNLGFFQRLGFKKKNLFANEIDQTRAHLAKQHTDNVIEGFAENLFHVEQFDIIFQSTMFSSIFNRKEVAEVMWRAIKPEGIILWYDMVVPSQSNHYVRPCFWDDVKSYWPKARNIRKHSVTLAPPIGRRVGRLYNFVNIPPLRTHIVAAFQK